MVNQKGGFVQWLLMNELFNKKKQQPQAQKGGLYIHRKKRKQKGGRAYTPIEEIRRRHFRKIMLKAMKNKKQKGGFIGALFDRAMGNKTKVPKPRGRGFGNIDI